MILFSSAVDDEDALLYGEPVVASEKTIEEQKIPGRKIRLLSFINLCKFLS